MCVSLAKIVAIFTAKAEQTVFTMLTPRVILERSEESRGGMSEHFPPRLTPRVILERSEESRGGMSERFIS